MTDKRIAVGADHGGVTLKDKLVAHLEARGFAVDDLGCHSSQSVDYPDYAAAVARKVASGEAPLGLLVCGTGIGMSMVANKVGGVRAAVVTDPWCAEMPRRHNNANVLCMGGRVVGVGLARAMLDAFLDAEFEGGRHQRRLDKMAELE